MRKSNTVLYTHMNNTGIALVVVILVGIAGVFYLYPSANTQEVVVEETPVACTQEAKICPDGSSVGRTGPKCEFTACPTIQINEDTTASLNQKIFNNGIFITPLEVLSDSRCPSDVVCISAGEISLRVMLEKGTSTQNVTLKLQSSTTFEGYKITFTNVTPAKNSKTALKNSDYRFTFVVTPLVVPAQGSISGHVMTSPTCAVERVPPEPQCSPKPYATSIRIREKGESAIIKTIQSDNSGAFTTSISPGSYELDALTVNNATLPRCTTEILQVVAGKNSVQDISCDTGIR